MAAYFGARDGAVALPQALVTTSLVALWELDETAGLTAVDSVGSLDGTYEGGFALGEVALVDDSGTAVAFDGLDGYIVIDHGPALALAEPTVVLTVRADSLPPVFNRVLFSKAGHPRIGETTIEQVLDGGISKIRAYVQESPGVVHWIGSELGVYPLPVGAILQIRMEIGESGTTLFVREPGGPWLNVASNPNAITGWTNNESPIHIGAYGPTTGHFDGSIDHVRIYSGPISDAEAAAIPAPVDFADPGDPGEPSLATLAPVAAFSVTRQRLTALAGWSGTPKEIAAQGDEVHAFLRRPSDYGPQNDGTYVDLVAGHRKTLTPDVIQIRLSDNSLVNVSIDVTRATPSPAKVLDRTGGGADYLTWTAALNGLTTGETLLVRARTGEWTDLAGYAIPNKVYPVTSKPVSTVNGCKVIGHPDDVAAGRVPVVMWDGDRLARYVYALGQSPTVWEEFQDLGAHGKIWRTRQTHPAPATYCGFYRAPIPKQQAGDPGYTWVALFSPRMPNQTSRLAVLQNTTYAPTSSWTGTGQPYRGPSLIYEPDGRYYVRLSPPREQVYNNPSMGAPWPPWNWNAYLPPSQDPNQVPIWIATGQTGAKANTNWLLGLASRSGWEIENIGFFSGNQAIYYQNASGTGLKNRGTFYVGGTTGDFFENSSDPGHNSDANVGLPAHISFTNINLSTDMEFDQCHMFGGDPPWGTWFDGKGYYGPGGQAVRRECFSAGSLKLVMRNCALSDWWQFCWTAAGSPIPQVQKLHLIHCLLRNFGSDGANISNGLGDYLMNRCRGELNCPSGISGRSGTLFTCVNSLMFNQAAWVATFGGSPTQTIYSSLKPGTYNRGVPWFCPVLEISHGNNSGCDGHHCQSLWIGAHGSIGSNLHGSNTQGAGSGMTPMFCGWSQYKLDGSRCFNNIGVLVPSPYAWPVGKSAMVASYRTDGAMQANFNHIWKVPGTYVAPASGGLTTLLGSGGNTATGRTSMAALFSATGREQNGTEGNPGFGDAPVYPSSDPFAPGGAFDLANYLLQPGGAARTGGSTALSGHGIKDHDLNTQVTWVGKAWRGPLAPDVPVIEQRVGILSPPMWDPVG